MNPAIQTRSLTKTFGHTDNSAYRAITVNIHADIVTPASMKGKKVPVMIGAARRACVHPLPAPQLTYRAAR